MAALEMTSLKTRGGFFGPPLRWRWKIAALPLPVAILDDLISGSANEVIQDGGRKRKGRHFPPPPQWGSKKPPYTTNIDINIHTNIHTTIRRQIYKHIKSTQGPLLLTLIPIPIIEWHYLSNPKLQQCSRCSFRMDKYFIPQVISHVATYSCWDWG